MDDDARWVDLLHCTFCGKTQGQVAKLIAGPGVYICDGCVTLARGWPGIAHPERHCGFCGQSHSTRRRLVAPGCTAICGDCLDLCDEIIAEEQAG